MNNEDKAKKIVKNLPFCEADWQLYKDYAYDAAIDMAKWKDETTILFLEKLADGFVIRDRIVGIEMSKEEIIESFKNFIEEQ